MIIPPQNSHDTLWNMTIISIRWSASCKSYIPHMGAVEKFCIFKEYMKIYQLKQKYKVQRNNVSETILQGEGQ